MWRIVFPILVVFLSAAISVPTAGDHIRHEKRNSAGSLWRRSKSVDKSMILPCRIGLTQSNLHLGEEILMSVSHPESPDYGKHWTAKQVAEMFAPSQDSVDAVHNWVTSAGISPDRILVSYGNSWVKFNASVMELEQLLKTEYHIYEHDETGQTHVATEEYSVPKDIQHHIDLIMPTVHFSVPVKARQPKDLAKRGKKHDFSDWYPKLGKTVMSPEAAQSSQVTYSLSNCNQYITPDCLRALYNFSNGTYAKSSIGIVEYSNYYLQSDLNLFYQNFAAEIPAGYIAGFNSIDGGQDVQTGQSFNQNGESDLDIEYAIALVFPQRVSIMQVGDTVEGGSFNDFLDGIDASYCTSGGGDDPNYDPTYPDPYSGGYQKQDCGIYNPPAVVSTSYGYNEADLGVAYETRQCNEYMKLGMLGVSFFFSSGDNGVAGNSAQCCTNPKCAGGTYSSSGKTFNPAFPATCPWVTVVGATQIVAGASVTAPEVACQTSIYSGGGFSNVFALPSYQSSAMSTYYSQHAPRFSPNQFNNSRTVRGYPDLAANGANYQVAVDGSIVSVFGTSASAPVVASIFTLINEQRVNAGKSTIGFINPTIYNNPSAFNDITSGSNPGCSTGGFSAVAGWDPVTGLGTPNYGKLLPIFMNLP